MPVHYTTKPALRARQSRANNANMKEAGMTDLSCLITALDPIKRLAVSDQLKKIEVSKLIATNTNAILKEQRTSAFLIALELTERGIAPFFRRSDLAPPESSIRPINQEYDLLVYDLLWLAKCDAISITVTNDPSTWSRLFKLADSLFWLGNRPIWQIVKKTGISERHQWECRLLKSVPIKRKARGLHQSAQHIYVKLADDLPSIMRTGTDEPTARLILQKRKRLWFCAEMCKWAPTETARLYGCMTGETLTRFQVANQLSKVAHHKRRRKTKAVECSETAPA